jgi:iron complex outermembrane receptor protein
MSELMNTSHNQTGFRGQLLASVSAFALVSLACASGGARASDDAGRPTLWIELGAQSEQVNGFGDPLDLPYAAKAVSDGFKSPLELQRALSQSFGEEGTISFQPENSGWIFSVSARYGKAQGGRTTHDQTPDAPIHLIIGTYTRPTPFTPAKAVRYSETRVRNTESHIILDFQAGKDIGVGLFGNEGKSTLGFGVRFAQFASKQTLGANADPDYYIPANVYDKKYHHIYAITSHVQRSFRGIGPSLSWNVSAPLLGNVEAGALALDWGMNASLLFGRQKTLGHHETTASFFKTKNFPPKYHFSSHSHHSGDPNRSHTAAVPNVGGFAGVSYAFPNAKLSAGYRADLFFGAMDGGIDARVSKNVGFYGPFAAVSVGVGG